jgi:Cupin-like domain
MRAFIAVFLCIFTASFSGALGRDASDIAEAAEAEQEAMRLAGGNQIADALPFFRRAVRLAPHEPNYWNNLGVTALRLALWDQAEASFMVALAVSPNHADAVDNLKETREYMMEKGIQTKVGYLLLRSDTASMNKMKQVALGEPSGHFAEDDHQDEDQEESGGPEEGDELDEESPPPMKASSSLAERRKADATKDSPKQPAVEQTAARRRQTWEDFVRARGIKHHVGRVPRVHINDLLGNPKLRNEFLRGQTPYILLGVLTIAPELLRLSGERPTDLVPTSSAALRDALATLASQALFGSSRSNNSQLVGPEIFTESSHEGAGAVGFGNVVSDFYPANMDDKDVRPFLTPLKDATAELVDYALRQREGHANGVRGAYPLPSSEHPGRYIHFNMGDDPHWQALVGPLDNGAATTTRAFLQSMPFGRMRVPPHFANTDEWLHQAFDTDAERSEFQKTAHWRMLLVGTEGAGMFFHQDTLATASWQLQLSGTKVWHLCHPDQSSLLSPDADMFKPDYNRFPKLMQIAEGKCWLEMARAGEMVFYPNAYWHQTLNFASPTAFTGVGEAALVDESTATGSGRSIWDDKALQKEAHALLQTLLGAAEKEKRSSSAAHRRQVDVLRKLQREAKALAENSNAAFSSHYLFSVGLTDTLGDWSNHRQLAKDLTRNCQRQNRVPGIHVSDAVCAKFHRIFSFWEEAYGRRRAEEVLN